MLSFGLVALKLNYFLGFLIWVTIAASRTLHVPSPAKWKTISLQVDSGLQLLVQHSPRQAEDN